jgi:hypothetical protein
MLWLSGMKKRDLLPLLPAAALLVASLVMTRFLDSSPVVTFPVAVFIGALSFVLVYLFSEDWRRLTLAQANRARVVLGSLTSRAKPVSPVNTNTKMTGCGLFSCGGTSATPEPNISGPNHQVAFASAVAEMVVPVVAVVATPLPPLGRGASVRMQPRLLIVLGLRTASKP